MIFFRIAYNFENKIELSNDELQHLKSLRLNEIDKKIEFRDGLGNSFFYLIPSKSKIGDLVHKEYLEPESSKIEIAQAIPKANRFEFLLQKNTELGIDCFHFINFEQSDRKEYNEDRAYKIVLEASSQAKRITIPKIIFYRSLKNFIDKNPNSYLLEPSSESSINDLKDWKLIPIIGPEGGFRDSEISLIKEKNIQSFHLGKNILKIETASIYMTSIIKFMNQSK
jgi:16S rRNA (uracil1498-N3)-methyltransferase